MWKRWVKIILGLGVCAVYLIISPCMPSPSTAPVVLPTPEPLPVVKTYNFSESTESWVAEAGCLTTTVSFTREYFVPADGGNTGSVKCTVQKEASNTQCQNVIVKISLPSQVNMDGRRILGYIKIPQAGPGNVFSIAAKIWSVNGVCLNIMKNITGPEWTVFSYQPSTSNVAGTYAVGVFLSLPSNAGITDFYLDEIQY